MGRYGVRQCSDAYDSVSRYEGTWTSGLQDGYGLETYSDGGTYQGQWMKGARHGYGVRKSAVYRDSAKCRSYASAHSSSLTSVRSVVELPGQLPAAAGGDGLLPGVTVTHDKHRQHHHHNAAPHHQPSLSTADRTLKPAAQAGFFLTGKCVDTSTSDDSQPPGSSSRRGSFLARQIPSVLRASLTGSSGGGDRQAGLGLRRQRSADDVDSGTETLSDSSGGGGGGGQHHRRHSPVPPHRIRDTVQTDPLAVEIYSGEWKNDKRSGYGVCERSDGLRYEGEWVDNCKCGYGVTTYGGGPDVPGGWREEGRYKGNVLLSPGKKLFLPLRSSKVRERIDAAVAAAVKAAQLAAQKSDIANSRMESARSKAELADQVAAKAFSDADKAHLVAKDVEMRERREQRNENIPREPSRQYHHQPLNTETMATRSNQRSSRDYRSERPQGNHIGYSEQRKPMSPYSDEPVDVGNDRIIFRDNSIVRRPPQRRLPSSSRPSQTPSRTPSLTQIPGSHPPQGSRTSLAQQQPDYSQMNHVDPATAAAFSRRQQRHVTGRVTPSDDGDRSSEDWTEEEFVGSGMNGGEDVLRNGDQHQLQQQQQATDSDVTGLQRDGGGDCNVTSRPSLRYRRDFRCPNLVIFNKAPSRVDMSTVCGGGGGGGGGMVGDAVGGTAGGRGYGGGTATQTGITASRGGAPIRRRLTMPSIVKYTAEPPKTTPSSAVHNVTVDQRRPTPCSSVTEMYIVENCTRKRIEEEDVWVPPEIVPQPVVTFDEAGRDGVDEVAAATVAATVIPVLEMTSLDGLDPPKPVTKRYKVQPSRLSKYSGRQDLGSLPDVSMVRQLQSLTPIPRHEAMLLCQQKRDEIRKLLEQEQLRRKRAIVLRLGDFKAWCEQRQLTLFLLAVNVALIVTFYKLVYD
jgi:junctophilin